MRYDPRIKPPPWGNLNDVQAAVRENCQRLGLPLPAFYAPVWEDCGDPHNIMVANDVGTASGNQTWGQGRIHYTGDHNTFTTYPQATDEVTIIAFDVLTTDDSNDGIFGAGTNDNWDDTDYLCMWRDGGGEFRFRCGDVDHSQTSSGTLSLNTQYVLAGVAENGEGDLLYIDGQPATVSTQTTSNGLAAGTVPFIMGRYYTTSTGWRGTIGQCLAFYAALTADQVALLHEQPYALIQPAARTRYFIPDAEPSEPGTGRGQLILISDGLKTLSPAAWAGVCGMSGVIRNPKLTKREMLNPLNWLRK